MDTSFSIESTKTFLKIIESLKDLFSQVPLLITDEGIQFQCMDDSHIVLTSLVLKTSFFTEFNCSKSIEMGINISSFIKILKVLNLSEVWKFIIKKDSLEVSAGNKKFTLKLMHIDQDTMDVPEFDYTFIKAYKCNELKTTIKDLKIHDSTEIAMEYSYKTPNILNLYSTSDSGDCNIQLDQLQDLLENMSICESIKENIRVCYSLPYIDKIIHTSISETLTLYLNESFPIKISYNGENYNLDFYLAPKVTDDDF